MLRSLKDLAGYRVSATDGDLGSVADFLFDDERWVVRHLVVETGGFLDGRGVLISPASFGEADWPTHRFHLALTRDAVKNSPSVEVDKPVSRQHERDFYRYYSFPYYWQYSGPWGLGGYPSYLVTAGSGGQEPAEDPHESPGDVHLRSAREVRKYHVQGSDAAIGSIDDFVVDDESWELRYLVIDTSHWWFGKKILVAPRWVSRINWQEREVQVALSRDTVQRSPAWDPAAPINRRYEKSLYDYYGRPVYWTGDSQTQAAHLAHAPASHHG